MTGTNPAKVASLKALGARLRRLRLAYAAQMRQFEITPTQMARVLGVEDERYRTWERGLREPPLWILVKLRELTGISIDTLLTGTFSHDTDLISFSSAEEYKRGQAMAERIHRVRELKEPDVEKAAEVMGVRLDRWLRWEAGLEPPTLSKLAEFAGRFSVSLDFLYAGRLVGVDRNFQDEVISRHPELLGPVSPPVEPKPKRTRKARRGGGSSSPQTSPDLETAA